LAIRTLTGIRGSRAAPAAARVSAATALLDRGWGRAPQVHNDADGGPIQITIRRLVDVIEVEPPLVIEHDDGDKVGQFAPTCPAEQGGKEAGHWTWFASLLPEDICWDPVGSHMQNFSRPLHGWQRDRATDVA
jgi:hypothetical protein